MTRGGAREEQSNLNQAIDRLNRQFGSHTIQSAALLDLKQKPVHPRDKLPQRYEKLFKGETLMRHLNIPRMTLGEG